METDKRNTAMKRLICNRDLDKRLEDTAGQVCSGQQVTHGGSAPGKRTVAFQSKTGSHETEDKTCHGVARASSGVVTNANTSVHIQAPTSGPETRTHQPHVGEPAVMAGACSKDAPKSTALLYLKHLGT